MELEIKLESLEHATVGGPQAFEKSRGLLMERFHAARSKLQEQCCEFAKNNGFDPVKGVLESAHFQYDPPRDKLMPMTGPVA